jgi:hypothetical protein
VGNNPLSVTDLSGEGFFDFLNGLIHDILNAFSGGLWGALTAAIEGGSPPIGGFGGVPGVGDLTGCGGALGNCGGSGTWSEDAGLTNVQNPGEFVSDFAQDPLSGFDLGGLWLLGNVPSAIYYPANSHGTQEMKRSRVVQNVRQRYVAAGCPALAEYASGHLEPWKESRDNLVFKNTTQFQVGGFVATFATSRDNVTSYTIFNTLSWSSFLGESTWGPSVGLRRNAFDNQGSSKLWPFGRNVVQTFVWTETNPCHK